MTTLSPPPTVLDRTPIYRMVHIECLDTLLQRGALHAPSSVPDDGLPYAGIHAQQVQRDRGDRAVPCGPGGVVRDYIGFYLGPRSPMLYRVHTGWNVERVDQRNIVYLVAIAQSIAEAGLPFVFTDRHSLAAVAEFRDDLEDLDIVDIPTAYAVQWNTTAEHPDRQEKKQAEFLVHGSMPWSLIDRIGVVNGEVATRVFEILDNYPSRSRPQVAPERSWYY